MGHNWTGSFCGNWGRWKALVPRHQWKSAQREIVGGDNYFSGGFHKNMTHPGDDPSDGGVHQGGGVAWTAHQVEMTFVVNLLLYNPMHFVFHSIFFTRGHILFPVSELSDLDSKDVVGRPPKTNSHSRPEGLQNVQESAYKYYCVHFILNYVILAGPEDHRGLGKVPPYLPLWSLPCSSKVSIEFNLLSGHTWCLPFIQDWRKLQDQGHEGSGKNAWGRWVEAHTG